MRGCRIEKESVCVRAKIFVRVCFKCVRECGLSSRTCWVVLVPPGSVCCWPTEATSAGLDGPCGARSIEAWWLASCRTKGAKGERPHSMGLYPMVACVCVGACERGRYPSGHGEQSRALSNHSLLSKAGQEGKGIVWGCAHNKSAFKVRVKGIFSNDALWCRLIKMCDLLQLPPLWVTLDCVSITASVRKWLFNLMRLFIQIQVYSLFYRNSETW